jgi:hypothetical protein
MSYSITESAKKVAQQPPYPIDEERLADLCHEGGVKFCDFLLAHAVPPVADFPDKSPQDWTFQDIKCLPETQQEEWRQACLEEINALKKRQVFDLVKLPKGRKAIKRRWVFDVKSNGRKRARYVAKGFSQIKRIDFEALFPPVIRYKSVRFMIALAALDS